ncbi:MAG: OmpA family protein [Chitinispirillaceae bacterium]|nr:OmpA family protein [Chitinispirillaceae bacterium]
MVLYKVKNAALTFAAAILAAVAPLYAVSVNTNGQPGVIRTQSAKVMGKTILHVGAGVNVYQSGDYVDDVVNPQGEILTLDHPGREQARMISTNLFCGAGITRFWDFAMALPLYYDWLGFDNKQNGGIGDLEFTSKFLYPSMTKRFFYQSCLAGLTIPTGMKNSGFFPRHPYYIEGNEVNPAPTFYSATYPTIKGLGLWTFDIGNVNPQVPLRFHLNLGGIITTSMKNQRNTVIGSFAAEYTPVPITTLFLDIHGESRWSNFATRLDPLSDPWLLSPGIRLTTASGLYLCFVGDLSLSSRSSSKRLDWNPESGTAHGYRYSTGVFPAYGVQFVLGWSGYIVTPDDDRDGIVNSDDRCPKEQEDVDGFKDDDGCPDPDNDQDGIPDVNDKCPRDPEDKDGYKDADGCPDRDNDGDGIQDSRDQCPGVGEDFDGYQDHDGCPDEDNDKDNVPDSTDRCPNDPEDVDGFQDNDGCPDIDNDQDGIPDLKDQCPDVPGTPLHNGCQPDTTTKPAKKEINFPKKQNLPGVNFRKGTANLSFESYAFLEPLVQKLREYIEVEIEVQCHTDASGNYTTNMQLSQLRAETIRQYLITKGVSPNRVRAVGFGSSVPIDDNKTASGRARNRRVEVLRTQ